MNRRAGLKAFLFCEAVLMTGALLFEIPVLIGRGSHAQTGDSRLTAVIVVTAVVFLAAGLAGLFRHKFWALLHLLAAALSFVSTMMMVAKGLPYASWIYFIPLIYAVIVSGIVFYFRKSSL